MPRFPPRLREGLARIWSTAPDLAERARSTSRIIFPWTAMMFAAVGLLYVLVRPVEPAMVYGFAATRAIRGGELGQRTPIVAMTANAMAGDRERCIEAGMDDDLAKPIDQRRLRAALERWNNAGRGSPSAGRDGFEGWVRPSPGHGT